MSNHGLEFFDSHCHLTAERFGEDRHEVVSRAHAKGLRVAVHVTSRYDFQIAVKSGADEIAHLPLEPLEDEDAVAAAEAGVVVVTTTLSHRPTPGV